MIKNPSACVGRQHRFNPWVRKTPWKRTCQPTYSCLEKSHGQRQATVHGVAKESNMSYRLNNNNPCTLQSLIEYLPCVDTKKHSNE